MAATCAGALLFNSTNAWAQNLYVSTDSAILEITPTGVESTFTTFFDSPEQLAFNSSGDLFVATYGYGQIIKVTPGGTQSVFAGSGGSLGGEGLVGLAIDGSGDVFTGNSLNCNIYKTTPSGVSSLFASGLGSPSALAFNSAGNLFVANEGGNIYELTPNGGQSIFASGVGQLYGLAFDAAGNLFVASEGRPSAILELTPQGALSTFFLGGGLGGGLYPEGLAFNSAGTLFATDSTNPDIFQFAQNGTASGFAPVAGGGQYLTFQPFQPVPEPSILGLLAVAAAALGFTNSRGKATPRRGDSRLHS